MVTEPIPAPHRSAAHSRAARQRGTKSVHNPEPQRPGHTLSTLLLRSTCGFGTGRNPGAV